MGIQSIYDDAYTAFNNGNLPKAISLYKELADAGYDNAALFLGEIYWYGYGVEKDESEAIGWFERAAKSRPRALFHLGNIYGNRSEFRKAYSYFKSASDQGYYPSLYKIALYNEMGRVKELDKKGILDCFKRAASKGHVFSQRELAIRRIKFGEGLFYFFPGLILLILTLRKIYLAARDTGLLEEDEYRV